MVDSGKMTLEQRIDSAPINGGVATSEYDAALVRCSAVKPPIDVMVLYTITDEAKKSVALCVYRNPDNSCDPRKYSVNHKNYHYPCELTRE